MTVYKNQFTYLLVTLFIGVVYSCNRREYPTGFVCVCSEELGCDEYPPIEQLKCGNYDMYTTSKDGDRFEKACGKFSHKSWVDSKTILTIYRKKKLQKIHGFGGAFTDAAGMNILSLSDETQTLLMESYYGKNGLEYSMGRVPIGGTDFSPRGYTYADNDTYCNLNSFSLQPEDFNYKIPIILRALNLTDLKLFGSAWTAPAWMKTNNRLFGIGVLNLTMHDLWAEYHIKFLDAYREFGINFWGLTTGNEPTNGLSPFIGFNDMGWDPIMHAQWITQNLGHKLRLNEYYYDMKIMILDDQRIFLPWIAKLLLEKTGASEYVDGIAVHYYTDKYVSADVLTITHYDFPDKFILATEACEGALEPVKVILGSWERATHYCNSIIDDLSNWSTGWMDWNIALDLEGGPTYVNNNVDSPIIVNSTSDEFYKQPMFYAVGHFSKFIPPDSVRLHSIYSGSDIKTVVFERPDNGTVVSAFNPTNKDVTIFIVDSSNIIEANIKANSMNTMIYWC